MGKRRRVDAHDANTAALSNQSGTSKAVSVSVRKSVSSHNSIHKHSHNHNDDLIGSNKKNSSRSSSSSIDKNTSVADNHHDNTNNNSSSSSCTVVTCSSSSLYNRRSERCLTHPKQILIDISSQPEIQQNGTSNTHTHSTVKNIKRQPTRSPALSPRLEADKHYLKLLSLKPIVTNELKQRLSVRDAAHNTVYQLQCFSTPSKGQGVKTLESISMNTFVCEYSGELMRKRDGWQREEEYADLQTPGREEQQQHIDNASSSNNVNVTSPSNNESNSSALSDHRNEPVKNIKLGCYMFYFSKGGKDYCIDATQPLPAYGVGRYINHSSLRSNLYARAVVDVKKNIHLCFFAGRDIDPDEELLIDYGDRATDSIEAFPWLLT